MKKFFLIAILILTVNASAEVVHRIIIEGVINPVATEYITKSIEQAE
ncbi:hypothetical protein [Caldithrix abyssi]